MSEQSKEKKKPIREAVVSVSAISIRERKGKQNNKCGNI